MDANVFSDEDVQLLKLMADGFRKQIQNQRLRPRVPEQLGQAPETYLVLTPVGGIPAIGPGTGTGTDDPGGPVSCEVYQQLEGDLFPTGFNVDVYNNASVAVPGNVFALITRDKFGTWYVVSSQGSAGADEWDGVRSKAELVYFEPPQPGTGTDPLWWNRALSLVSLGRDNSWSVDYSTPGSESSSYGETLCRVIRNNPNTVGTGQTNIIGPTGFVVAEWGFAVAANVPGWMFKLDGSGRGQGFPDLYLGDSGTDVIGNEFTGGICTRVSIPTADFPIDLLYVRIDAGSITSGVLSVAVGGLGADFSSTGPGVPVQTAIGGPFSSVTPAADGSYVTGLGGTQNGVITIQSGIITAIQEALP